MTSRGHRAGVVESTVHCSWSLSGSVVHEWWEHLTSLNSTSDLGLVC